MSNPLSYSSVKLDIFTRNDSYLGQASGFVVETANRHYLITNRHLVSNSEISSHGQQTRIMEPYTIKTSIHIHGGDKKSSFPLSWGVWKKITIQLYDNDHCPKWLQHQTNEQTQSAPDVIALSIHLNYSMKFNQALMQRALMQYEEKFLGNRGSTSYWSKISAIPISTIDTDVEYNPPDPVYIVGYPIGWSPAGTEKSSAAFWRMSSIASELDVTGTIRTDMFFIDPFALEGMSGSPVIGLKNGHMKLLGIYSARSTREFSINAGVVWKASTVKALIDPS